MNLISEDFWEVKALKREEGFRGDAAEFRGVKAPVAKRSEEEFRGATEPVCVIDAADLKLFRSSFWSLS